MVLLDDMFVLMIEEGKDLVILFICILYMINMYCLLVMGYWIFYSELVKKEEEKGN